MMSAPYDYTTINLATSAKTPNSVHCKNSYIVSYFTRYLFNKLISVFDFKNLPKTWDKDYFIYNLYKAGFVTVFNTDRFGVIPQACSLSGINVFYRPTTSVILKREYALSIVIIAPRSRLLLSYYPKKYNLFLGVLSREFLTFFLRLGKKPYNPRPPIASCSRHCYNKVTAKRKGGL